jgi:hypothetical protein
MPVIRGEPRTTVLTEERRKVLLDKLRNELAERTRTSDLLIFEIPLEQSDKIDVLVVWQAFESLRSEDRTRLILDAYPKTRQRTISLALGVTYQEAMEQALLPYAVRPLMRRGEADPDELRKVMLEVGGIALPEEKVDLRFPTMAMAEAAYQKLCDRLPGGHWAIVQTLDSTP